MCAEFLDTKIEGCFASEDFATLDLRIEFNGNCKSQAFLIVRRLHIEN